MASTLSAVTELIRANANIFHQLVHQELFSQEYRARQLFPVNPTEGHQHFAEAVCWALENTDPFGELTDEAKDHLRELALTHRRLGFPLKLYESLSPILVTALKELNVRQQLAVPPSQLFTAEKVLTDLCLIMTRATSEADLAGVPPANVAEVTHVERITSQLSAVQVTSSPGPQYEPGQALYVTATYLPGIWRALTPAGPANPGGSVDFLLQADSTDDAMTMMATPRVGDKWTIGGAHSGVPIDPKADDITIIAYGTGFAAAQALVFSLIDKPTRPTVHLIITTQYPGEVYGLKKLRQLATYTNWLEVIVVVDQAEDPWWLPRPGTSPKTASELGLIVADPLSFSLGLLWKSNQIVLLGPRNRVDGASQQLAEAGLTDKIVTARRADWY